MTTRLLALACFLLASGWSANAGAQTLFSWTATETGGQSELRLLGTWANSCAPDSVSVTRIGRSIELRTLPDPFPNLVCDAVVTPWTATAPLGALPAGRYDVRVLARLAAPDGVETRVLGEFAFIASGAGVGPAEPVPMNGAASRFAMLLAMLALGCIVLARRRKRR